MESLELANRITEIIVDKQGEDILILDLQDVTTIADYFIICSGASQRQISAIDSAIREAMKQADEHLMARNIADQSDSGWILIDFNSVIIHLFNHEMREYYQLEELWKNARVVARIQ